MDAHQRREAARPEAQGEARDDAGRADADAVEPAPAGVRAPSWHLGASSHPAGRARPARPQGGSMSRGQGRCFKPVVRGAPCSVYWLDYSIRGERHRESSHTTSRKEALDLLRERIGGRKAGTLTGQPDRVTFADLRQLVERQYTLDGNRSLARVQLALQHVEDFVGATVRALDLTPELLDRFAEHRLAEGA